VPFARFRAFRDPNVLPTDCQFHASLNRANAPGQAVTDPPRSGGLARLHGTRTTHHAPRDTGPQLPHSRYPVDARQAGGIIGL